MDGLLESSHSFFRDNPRPDLEDLYSSKVKAAVPEPVHQLTSSLSAQLTRTGKDALDLLSAWPLCTREQLAGLVGGVTLDRWSPEPSHSKPSVYAGTALRALKSQLRHHAGVVGFAASLSAEVARSPDYDLFDPLPTHRSSIGYRHDQTTYAIHPDASFTLEYKSDWRPFLLEFERRATTPKRIPKRLRSYRRYFRIGWAKRDHEGHLPHLLFVFESPDSETAFLDIADESDDTPIVTTNVETLAEHGVLGKSWILPPPYSLHRRPLALTYQAAQ